MNNTATNEVANVATFTIPTKQVNNSRTVNIASLLMVATSLIAFLYKAVNLQQTIVAVCCGALLLLTLYWLYNTFKNRQTFTYLHIILLMAALYWFIQGNTVGVFVGIALVIAAIFEQLLKRKPSIVINTTGVAIKGAFTTTLPWAELTNVIIRDGLVTIDAKNNKIWQKEAADDIPADDERVINGYCSSHIQ